MDVCTVTFYSSTVSSFRNRRISPIWLWPFFFFSSLNWIISLSCQRTPVYLPRASAIVTLSTIELNCKDANFSTPSPHIPFLDFASIASSNVVLWSWSLFAVLQSSYTDNKLSIHRNSLFQRITKLAIHCHVTRAIFVVSYPKSPVLAVMVNMSPIKLWTKLFFK